MEETRKIGDYSVKYSVYIGHKDIALGENPNADKDERYMCCFVETNAIFERYSGVLVSDDFAEIAKVFGQRVADAAEEIIQENERACQEVGTNEELTTNSCKPISYEDSIENKVVVVKGSILRPEFRHANHQLMLCTGGFGAAAFLCTTGERPPFIARIFSVSWRKSAFPNGRRRAWRKRKRCTRRKRNRLKKEVTQDDRV